MKLPWCPVMTGHLMATSETYTNFAHSLNLIFSLSVMRIKECKSFFATWGGIAAFFAKSMKRIQFWTQSWSKDYQNLPLRDGITTAGWYWQSEHRTSLMKLFENVSENSANEAQDIQKAQDFKKLSQLQFCDHKQVIQKYFLFSITNSNYYSASQNIFWIIQNPM